MFFYKKIGILLSAAAFILFSNTLHSTPPEQRGMALGLFSKDLQYSYYNDLKEMKALGITDVLLVVSWYQHDIKSNEIVPRSYDGNDILTLPDEKLKEVIAQAHSLGMKVLLFPILRLEVRNGNDWRGIIAPADLNQWWRNYNRFVLHYAKLGQENSVEVLSIGSELLSREEETDRWSRLIDEVRKTYPGKLIYSANWDHYQHPQFWKLLDYIGMTAYYELSKTKTPVYKDLKAKWREIERDFLAWKAKYPDKKLVITEIGYPSIDGASMYPWNYFLEGEIDIDEQALCYKAFIETWKKSKALAGVYFWVWWGEGGGQDNSYTPRGKPAAKWIEKWYKQKFQF